ncbi:MAG: hypothetical protein LBQ91_06805 [Oscillospiraceae bacterium]|jgi:hypothetical protein|nr:hypothetical protein [Oscillospiraceae bacterium]
MPSNRKNAALYIVPALAAIMGAALFVLRKNHLKNGFEPPQNLPYAGAASWRLLLFGLVVLFILALVTGIFVSRAAKHTEVRSSAVSIKTPALFTVNFLFGAALIVCGGILMLNDAYKTELAGSGALWAAAALGAVGIAAGIVQIAASCVFYSRKKVGYSGAARIMLLLPEIFTAYWVVIVYRHTQVNPSLPLFVFRIVSLAAASFFLYYRSGFFFYRASPGRFTFFSVAAIGFCGLLMADTLPLSERLFAAAVLVLALVSLTVFVAGVVKGERRRRSFRIEGQEQQ